MQRMSKLHDTRDDKYIPLEAFLMGGIINTETKGVLYVLFSFS